MKTNSIITIALKATRKNNIITLWVKLPHVRKFKCVASGPVGGIDQDDGTSTLPCWWQQYSPALHLMAKALV